MPAISKIKKGGLDIRAAQLDRIRRISVDGQTYDFAEVADSANGVCKNPIDARFDSITLKGNTKKLSRHQRDRVITQLIPDAQINLTIEGGNASNTIGGYKFIMNPVVGHKVYARVVTDDAKAGVCWWKGQSAGYDEAFDFLTGAVINGSSAAPAILEGMYDVIQDMVWTDGYMQVYAYKYAGLPSGTHNVTIQLYDLTKMYGAGNEPKTIDELKVEFPEVEDINKKGDTTIKAALPEDYTEVEYLESTGTQYLNLGHLVDYGDVMECEFYQPEGDDRTSIALFGQRISYALSNYAYWTKIDNKDTLRVLYGDGLTKEISNLSYCGRKNIVVITPTETLINGHYEFKYNSVSSEVSTDSNMYLFTSGITSFEPFTQYAFRGKIYRFSVKGKNGFIPVIRKSDNKPGMYDLVSGQFFTNAGTGEFIAGPEIPGKLIDADVFTKRGKNLFDYEEYFKQDSRFTIQDDEVSGLANYFNVYFKYYIPKELIGKTLTFSCLVKSSGVTNIRVIFNNINGTIINSSEYRLSTITFTPTSENDYIGITYGSGGSSLMYAKDFMFNFGSTPSIYEPYQEPEVIDFSKQNIWDEEWERGGIDSASGQNYNDSGRIRSTNYIRVKPGYSYSMTQGSSGRVFFYDEDKQYLSNAYKGVTGTVTIPDDAHYLRFHVTGTEYAGDISIIDESIQPIRGINSAKDEIIVNGKGKNLFDISKPSKFNNPGKVTINNDKIIISRDTKWSNVVYNIADLGLEKGKTYTISLIMTKDEGCEFSFRTETGASFVYHTGRDVVSYTFVLDDEYEKGNLQFQYRGSPSSGSIEFSEIMVEESSTATSYEPYLPNKVWRLEKYGERDLGTPNWTYNTFYERYEAEIVDKKNGWNNVICAKYQLPTSSEAVDMTDKMIKGFTSNNKIAAKDSSFTDVTSFKNAMQGVKLVYEKAIPEWEDITDTPQGQALLALSTEEGRTSIIEMSNDGEADAKYMKAIDVVPDSYTRVKSLESDGNQKVTVGQAHSATSMQSNSLEHVEPKAVLFQDLEHKALEVEGKALKYNQLVDKSKIFQSYTINGVTFTNNGDGTITANGTATAQIVILVLNYTGSLNDVLISNHKYLLKGCPINGSGTKYDLRINAFRQNYVLTDYGNGTISSYEPTSGYKDINIVIRSGVTVNNLVFKPQLVDLTDMFGAGNEPTTLEEFYATPQGKLYRGYVEYGYHILGAGEYKSNQLVQKEYVSTSAGVSISYEGNGVFLLNGTATGRYPSITNAISFKSGHKYLFKTKVLGGTFSGNSISLNTYNSFRKTWDLEKETIEECVNDYNQSIQFALGSDMGTFNNYRLFIQCSELTDIGLDDLTISQLKAQRPDLFVYQPYHETETRYGMIFNDGSVYPHEPLYGIGDVKDKQSTNGVRNGKFGVVKLKDLNWVMNETGKFYADKPENDLKKESSGNPNILTNKYETVARISLSLLSDRKITLSSSESVANKRILICDLSYSDATSFKNHFTDNDFLVYEKATQTTTQSTPATIKDDTTAINEPYAVAYSGASVSLAKYYDGDSAIANLVPVVRNSDLKPGLYEVASGEFKTNEGTGEFTYTTR